MVTQESKNTQKKQFSRASKSTEKLVRSLSAKGLANQPFIATSLHAFIMPALLDDLKEQATIPTVPEDLYLGPSEERIGNLSETGEVWREQFPPNTRILFLHHYFRCSLRDRLPVTCLMVLSRRLNLNFKAW